MNPKIDKLLAAETPWKAELAALRRICLATGMSEELKWGKACYTLDGGNVALLQGFKSYCAVLFFKGALLNDPQGILVRQTDHVQSARQVRFSGLAEVRRSRTALADLLRDAMAKERAGATVPKRPLEQYPMPDELRQRLDTEPALARAFGALTPGRQKAYLLFIGSAKRPQTRLARIDKHAARIRQGLGMDD